MTYAGSSPSLPPLGKSRRDIDSRRHADDLPAADVLVVDNYDSFTHNVVDILAQLGVSVGVIRNDRTTPEGVLARRYRAVVLSPGPGRPGDAGICLDLVRALGTTTPVLGICLGHQVLAEAHGGLIIPARRPLHGSAAPLLHEGQGLLRGLPSPLLAARYHSLVVDAARPGRGLVVTARSAEGDVMALRHRTRPLEGVQFHPESYLTPDGPALLAAFLRGAGLRPRSPAAVLR